jgi:hypothetical protein
MNRPWRLACLATVTALTSPIAPGLAGGGAAGVAGEVAGGGAHSSAPTGASQSAPTADGDQGPRDERTQEALRLLHLTDGRILRGKARWNGATWELLEGGQWRALEDGAVVRAAREREVLERSRELLAKTKRGDPTQRLMAADWMLREGLADEALRELNTILTVEPDHAGVRQLLAKPPVPLAAPGSSSPEPREAVRAAAVRPRVVQELAIAALGRRTDTDAVRASLGEALGSHSPQLRSFAALALRRLHPGEEPKALTSRAVLDSSEQVRVEAARALRDIGEEGVILPVVRALASSHPTVRGNAAETLGTLGFPAAVAPLVSRLGALAAPQSGGGGWQAPASHIFVGRQVAYVQDYDVEVAQFSSIADPQINVALEGSVLDVRVIGVSESSVALESRRIRTALAKLTGANPGATNRSWLEWWEQNKARYGVRGAPRTGPLTPSGRAD